ncbi:hypothetical protein [Thermocatellispora tengchongensis]|uniref:hypothetical protein n=1 Tax=Thermocatellispora tengchongensis TaxID=1073253 RepID=UPI003642D6EC
MTRPNLARRVADAAEIALTNRKYVTIIDVLTGVRWLHSRHVDIWRQGRVASLDELTDVSADRLIDTADLLRRWAESKGLRPVEIPYVAGTRDRRELRFTATGDEAAERAFRIQWLSPEVSETRARKLAEKVPDLTVVIPEREWTCATCGGTGPYLIMEDDAPHCLTCTDLDHLVFLPAGNAALSRRAKRKAVCPRWSSSSTAAARSTSARASW